MKKLGRCVAAIVTDVRDDESIEATAFPPKSAPTAMANVKKGDGAFEWHWPEQVVESKLPASKES